jgi:peptide/nickel transport system substrate-binding protein
VVTQDALPVEEAPALLGLEEQGEALAYFQSDAVFEHIDFGINSYGDYGDGLGRPDWFEDIRVRRAMTMCTNRQRMIDELTYGRGEMMHAYISSTHPLYPADVAQWPYDPAAANTLLNEVGYVDLNGDGIREDPATAITFTVSLRTDEGNGMRQRLTEIFQANMRDCGIGVELAYLPAAQWYADGPDGPLFGRRFDLAEFAWVTNVRPPCNLYLSQNVTGSEEEGFGGWGNVNATGWVHQAYDAACQSAFRALPGMPEYEANHQEAVRIFSQELPIIPLFSHVKIAATRPGVLNFRLDVTEASELWNLYELDLEQE